LPEAGCIVSPVFFALTVPPNPKTYAASASVADDSYHRIRVSPALAPRLRVFAFHHFDTESCHVSLVVLFCATVSPAILGPPPPFRLPSPLVLFEIPVFFGRAKLSLLRDFFLSFDFLVHKGQSFSFFTLYAILIHPFWSIREEIH